MGPFFYFGRFLTASFALPPQQARKGWESCSKLHHHTHSAVISPYLPYVSPAVSGGEWRPKATFLTQSTGVDTTSPGQVSASGKEGEKDTGLYPKYESLEQLCSLLGASPSDRLYLSTAEDGERGVYLRSPAKKNDVILRVPLSSCLRDDRPPAWYAASCEDVQSTEDQIDDCMIRHNPSDWATRLGASLIDLHLSNRGSLGGSDLENGLSLWMSMLPDRKFLRASLPVHWSEETISAAKCTALELAVDASYFARAEAVADISLNMGSNTDVKGDVSGDDLTSLCHDMFDLVQTRTCRVEREQEGGRWGPPLRILAPIFDFINHGSAGCEHEGCANAMFRLEADDMTEDGDLSLVVRATKDIDANDEILIDYGESARPAWRCLASYGFVPEYWFLNAEGDELEDESVGDECVAELYMDGIRYEVGLSTVPYDMVEAAYASQKVEDLGNLAKSNEGGDIVDDVAGKEQGDDLLTPTVALKIAKRISEVAWLLLLEPVLNIGDDSERNSLVTPEAVIAARLAASLRWSQHKVLLACAVGLRDFAARQSAM